MYKFLSGIKKEFLILVRDPAGLAILFIMPMFLIVVVTLTQENALKSIRGSQIKILFVDEDNSRLSKTIRQGLDTTGCFEIITNINSQQLTEKTASEAIASGKYQIGILIPRGAYSQSLRRADAVISNSFRKNDSTNISGTVITGVNILLDPAINDAYKNSVVSALKMLVQGAEIQILTEKFCSLLPAEVNKKLRIPIESELKNRFQRMQTDFEKQVREKMGKFAPAHIDMSDATKRIEKSAQGIHFTIEEAKFPWKPGNVLMVKEIIASHRQETIKPTVVQNNVPAFALFAMFFIVIPLSGSLITEKNEGAYNRLRTLPISYFTILSSKTVVYVIVCLLQLLMMMAVGIWFFPAVFGMPALQTGNHVGLILVSALASALAAVGFGMLIGTLSHTIGQAAMFGSLFVVILSILGGIFIPVYLMPAPLQAVSIISPIRWGLDSFLDIFVRKATFAAVLPNICRLIVFFVLVQFISLFSFVKRN